MQPLIIYFLLRLLSFAHFISGSCIALINPPFIHSDLESGRNTQTQFSTSTSSSLRSCHSPMLTEFLTSYSSPSLTYLSSSFTHLLLSSQLHPPLILTSKCLDLSNPGDPAVPITLATIGKEADRFHSEPKFHSTQSLFEAFLTPATVHCSSPDSLSTQSFCPPAICDQSPQHNPCDRLEPSTSVKHKLMPPDQSSPPPPSSHTTTQIISCGQLLDCEIITTTFLVDNQLSLHSELKSPASLRYENTILQSHSVDFQLLTRLTPITSCPFLRKEEWDEVDKLITTLIASL